jgi:hypothetical protein
MVRLLVAFLFWTLYARGQAITAKVVGTVVDPSGAAVPNATIGVKNVDTRSDSTFDIRQRLSIGVMYDVPLFMSSRKAMRTLLGGWQFGTIITEQTGFAASLERVVDTTGTGIASRVNVVAGQNPMLPRDQRTRDR